MSSAVLVAMAAILATLGMWGVRQAPRLAPVSLPERERRHRQRVLRRGGVACVVVAVLLGAVGTHSLVSAW